MKIHNFLQTAIKASSFSLSVLLMSGCATQFDDYEGSSTRAAVANACQQRELITSDDFAHYSALQMGWGARQNMTIVDDSKLKSMYLHKVAQFRRWEPRNSTELEEFKLRCADISVVASRVRGVGSNSSQSAPVYRAPTTTNCMTTYGWTRCTTN